MKQYAICSDDLNEIQQQINNDEDNDNYDLIEIMRQRERANSLLKY